MSVLYFNAVLFYHFYISQYGGINIDSNRFDPEEYRFFCLDGSAIKQSFECIQAFFRIDFASWQRIRAVVYTWYYSKTSNSFPFDVGATAHRVFPKKWRDFTFTSQSYKNKDIRQKSP